MSPINGGTSTYCQTGFGWTDTWFPTAQPTVYDQHLDVLSGDDAPSLRYTVNGTPVTTGNQFSFLSPSLDGGLLSSQNIGGGATLVSDIPAAKLTNSGSSTVAVGQVQIGITTTVNANNSVTEAFTFTNTSTTSTVSGLTFDDYFNFHPDGSTAPGNNCGSTSINPTTGMVTTVGQAGAGCPPVVSSGSMVGSSLPTTWDLGNVGQANCSGTPPFCTFSAPGVLQDIANGTFNKATGPTPFGDTGADVVWDLADLAAGASETFTITKNFAPVPEPASLALLGSALFGFGAVRCRRRKS